MEHDSHLPVLRCKECRSIAHKVTNLLGFRDGRVRCICGWKGEPWKNSEEQYLAHIKSFQTVKSGAG